MSPLRGSELPTAICLLPTVLPFQRKSFIPPGVKAADEDVYVRVVVLFEGERRTGARMLVVSGAVDDDGAAARDFFDPLFEFQPPDAEAPGDLSVALPPVFGVARVEEDGVAPRLDQSPSLLRADELRLRACPQTSPF